jgi:hypothetical protein
MISRAIITVGNVQKGNFHLVGSASQKSYEKRFAAINENLAPRSTMWGEERGERKIRNDEENPIEKVKNDLPVSPSRD